MPTRGEKKKKMTLTTHCWLLAQCCCLRQRLPKNGNQRICSVVGAPIFRWWWHTNYWADNVVSVKLQMWPRFMAVCNFKDITMKGSRRRRQILLQGTSCSVSHHIVNGRRRLISQEASHKPSTLPFYQSGREGGHDARISGTWSCGNWHEMERGGVYSLLCLGKIVTNRFKDFWRKLKKLIFFNDL